MEHILRYTLLKVIYGCGCGFKSCYGLFRNKIYIHTTYPVTIKKYINIINDMRNNKHIINIMETLPKLVVRNIIGASIDGYSRVTVANDLFAALNQSVRARFSRQTPKFAYKAMGEESGKGIRVFNIDGVELYSHYDTESGKTFFLMKTEEAEAHLVTLAEQRAGEEKLPFNISKFNLNVVASA